ncbi:MAG: SPOR domain-containing protein [Sphingomonadales bacterium]|nr:SPOR domain-containing protein [Sphingomonadales bacterium]
MTNIRQVVGGSLTAFAAVGFAGSLLPAPAFGQSVDDRALSDLRVDNVGGCTTLTVNFNIRVQLLSYFPHGSGRQLRIRVQPLDPVQGVMGKESLRPPATYDALQAVEFDGSDANGGVLTLTFTHDVGFDVEAGERAQSLVLKLSGPAGCQAAGTAAATPAATGRPALPPVTVPPGLYVVNLASQAGTMMALSEPQKRAIAGQVAYQTQSERDAQHWHRLRLGFFATREEAEAARKRLAGFFPDAWTLKVTDDERAAGISGRIDTGSIDTGRGSTGAGTAPTAATTEADRAETAQLTSDAEQAIKEGNLDRAVQLLANATAKPESDRTPRALELLALTHERKGQTAHAQAEYEDYLRRFPSGEAAERVRQRLASLAAPADGTPQLRAASGATRAATAWRWGARGSFSQFYYRDQSTTKALDATRSQVGPDVDNSVNLNQLVTSADVTVTGGNDRTQLQLRAAGSYSKSFGTPFNLVTTNAAGQVISRVGSGNSKDLESLTALYVDWTDRDLGVSARIGRQTRNSAGVLGRFDGGLVGWQASPKLRVNFVAGFPVLSSHQMEVLNKRPFYGVSVDFGRKRDTLQTSLYWFDQHVAGGFVDRRSVGIETRFLKKNFNAFALIDYDVKFKRLNLGLITLNYSFPDHSTISATADYRQSPLLTTSNALYGMFTTDPQPQAILDLRGLRPFFTDQQIYQLAKDRTLVSKSLTLAYSRPLTSKLQANVDFNLTDTGGTPDTPATAGTGQVFGQPAIGKEYYYGAQLVGSGLLWSNDIYILSGRYADTHTTHVYTADINARVPLTRKFRLSPRLRYGYRTNKFDAGNFRQFQPTLQANWYPFRHGEVEVEFGGNFTRENSYTGGSLTRTTESGYVITAGYRLDF